MSISVKIVIPIYKPQLTDLEYKSLKQCFNILGNHEIVFVAPEKLNVKNYLAVIDTKVIRFSNYFFESISGYNQLMLSPHFYSEFIDVDYILIYQLDAYVFRDELIDWCEKGYDYIGAPVHNVRLNNYYPPFSLVTLNGGFSLRKISSHLKVLKSFRFIFPFKMILKANINENGYLKGGLKAVYSYLFCNNVYFKLNKFDRNEDFFWAIIAKKLFHKFIVPNPEISCEFSIDNMPEQTFKLANYKLPFGCHAIDKYYIFWENYL